MMRGLTFISAFTLGAVFAVPASALVDEATWRVIDFPGIEPTTFAFNGDGEVEVIMDQSSAALALDLDEGQQTASGLSWQWKVMENVPVTSMAEKGDDDRAVAINVWFPDKKSGRVKRFFARLAGYEIPGRVITYTWGGTGSKGDVIENPYLPKKGFYIILRPGAFNADGWQDEAIDFRADFKRIFGEDAPAPTLIAISGDSDDTETKGRAAVRNLELIYQD